MKTQKLTVYINKSLWFIQKKSKRDNKSKQKNANIDI